MVRTALQHRLLSLAGQIDADAGEGGPLSIFRLQSREGSTLLHPAPGSSALLLLLEGRAARRREIFHAGQLLWLPSDQVVHLRCAPCSESGRFRAVMVRFSAAFAGRLHDRWPEPEQAVGTKCLRVVADEDLIEALCTLFEAHLVPHRFGGLLLEQHALAVLVRLRRLPDPIDIVGPTSAIRGSGRGIQEPLR